LADASFLGEYSLDYASYYVSTAGDVNGDGYDDFLVGAFGGIENFVPGDAYIMLGRVAPLPVEFIPDALSGKIREWHSFTGEYWEPNGWSDINQVSLKVGKSTTDPKLLSVAFEPDSNALYLLDNFTDQWVGPCAPGAHIILQSSYFQLDCRNSSVQYYSDHLFKVSGGFAGYSLLSLRDS
jgi:hypothetical protein